MVRNSIQPVVPPTTSRDMGTYVPRINTKKNRQNIFEKIPQGVRLEGGALFLFYIPSVSENPRVSATSFWPGL